MRKYCALAMIISSMLLFSGCGDDKSAQQTKSNTVAVQQQNNIESDMKKLIDTAKRAELTEAELKQFVKDLKKCGIDFNLLVPKQTDFEDIDVIEEPGYGAGVLYLKFAENDYKYPGYHHRDYDLRSDETSELGRNIAAKFLYDIKPDKNGFKRLSHLAYQQGMVCTNGRVYLMEDGNFKFGAEKLRFSKDDAERYIKFTLEELERQFAKTGFSNLKVTGVVARPIIGRDKDGYYVCKNVLVGFDYERKLYASTEKEHSELEFAFDKNGKFLGIANNKSTQVFSGHLEKFLGRYNGKNAIKPPIVPNSQKANNNSLEEKSKDNATSSSTVVNNGTGTITGNDVDVRIGAGTNYKSLGVFFKGDIVRVVDQAKSDNGEIWYKVEYNNPSAGLISGWVHSNFITVK